MVTLNSCTSMVYNNDKYASASEGYARLLGVTCQRDASVEPLPFWGIAGIALPLDGWASSRLNILLCCLPFLHL